MILLDTDICIELLRGNKNIITQREKHSEEVAVSFMTVAELYYGAEKSPHPAKNIQLVDKFIISIPVIHTNMNILRTFGLMKARFELKGERLADADVLIAATAVETCTLLVTGNIRHFSRFDNLRLENWIR